MAFLPASTLRVIQIRNRFEEKEHIFSFPSTVTFTSMPGLPSTLIVRNPDIDSDDDIIAVFNDLVFWKEHVDVSASPVTP